MNNSFNIKNTLDEKSVQEDPFVQFRIWFNQAVSAGLQEPTAMILATSTKEGKTSARVVLLKKFDGRGFIFFTNYESNKAKQIKSNPNAALVFYWHQFERQIRIEGVIKKISSTESDEYFETRTALSRISAIVSPQSQIIPDRDFLVNLFDKAKTNLSDKEIKRPKNWGGFCLNPNYFEFWQGRENRLHDRIVYSKKRNGWLINRLAP